MAGFLDWWDSAELWLTGRGFVLQTIIVMPIALTLAYGIALVLDAVLGWGQRALHRLRHDEETPL